MTVWTKQRLEWRLNKAGKWQNSHKTYLIYRTTAVLITWGAFPWLWISSDLINPYKPLPLLDHYGIKN